MSGTQRAPQSTRKRASNLPAPPLKHHSLCRGASQRTMACGPQGAPLPVAAWEARQGSATGLTTAWYWPYCPAGGAAMGRHCKTRSSHPLWARVSYPQLQSLRSLRHPATLRIALPAMKKNTSSSTATAVQVK